MQPLLMNARNWNDGSPRHVPPCAALCRMRLSRITAERRCRLPTAAGGAVHGQRRAEEFGPGLNSGIHFRAGGTLFHWQSANRLEWSGVTWACQALEKGHLLTPFNLL
jgi:hypothetical protein